MYISDLRFPTGQVVMSENRVPNYPWTEYSFGEPSVVEHSANGGIGNGWLEKRFVVQTILSFQFENEPMKKTGPRKFHKGMSTSSFSSSVNNNGKEKRVGGTTVHVNDNGKTKTHSLIYDQNGDEEPNYFVDEWWSKLITRLAFYRWPVFYVLFLKLFFYYW